MYVVPRKPDCRMDGHAVRVVHGRVNAMIEPAGVCCSKTRDAVSAAEFTGASEGWIGGWGKVVVWASVDGHAGSSVRRYCMFCPVVGIRG